ncbi:hypothetical protein ACNVED_16050 (plasmid) [Legionella sp. D16C41]|uniref:hypothetical protein n=1 Tax=Legionella sp. D16C41 TaxID=3402688 RepID=UPI003AF4E684
MYSPKSDEKIFVYDYKKYPPSKLKNLVKAIRKITFPLPKPIKTLLSSIFIVPLTIGSLGLALPLIFKIKDLSYQIDQEKLAEKFYKKISAKISNGFLKPPSNHPIEMKSKTRAFNHVNDYAIENKVLWCRRRWYENGSEELGAWKPIYFDALNQNTWPICLTVDGANLCVVDNHGDVHYRKILTEARGKNQKKSHSFQMDTPSIRQHLPKDFQSTEQYIAIDKSEKANWKPMWYSFPFLNRIINFFTGKRLNVKGQFIISHRGRYNDTYLDADGHQHPTSVGVTTGYELSKDGSTIIKYDPWAPTLSRILFFFPETKETTYSIKKIDVGASCLMALGHKIDRKTGISKITLLTNLCDIDILGGNPGLNYAYQTEHPIEAKIRDKDLRILPDEVSNEGWVEHDLPNALEQPIEFYNQITVIQKPHDQRELRIAAKLGDTLGYYFKDLSPQSSWIFKKYDWIDTTESIKQMKKRDLVSLRYIILLRIIRVFLRKRGIRYQLQ